MLLLGERRSRIQPSIWLVNKKKVVSTTLVIIISLSTLVTSHLRNTISHRQEQQQQQQQQQQHRRLKLQNTNDAWPDIAWLMSFRSSGSFYTLNLLRSTTSRTTATNYGLELEGRQDQYQHAAFSSSGPFKFDRRDFPSGEIATSTHCMDYCTKCSRAGMYALDAEEFYRWCASGSWWFKKKEKVVEDPNLVYNPFVYNPRIPVPIDAEEEEEEEEDVYEEMEAVRYDPHIVTRGVHLIENPYRNLIMRFFDAVDRFGEGGDYHNEGKKYEKNPSGFREWCNTLDDYFYMQEFILYNMDVVTAIKRIPCHSEFLLYGMWHNAAFELAPKMNMEVMQLHTEDFHHDMDGNIDKLLSFYNLKRTPGSSPPPYQMLETSAYYNSEEKVLISSFLKVISSQASWKEIKRYLPPPELSDTDEFHHIGSILSPQHYGEWPYVAWLMSFPNSGTFFTTQLLQIASRTTTATNYALEVGPRYMDIPNFQRTNEGPFRTSTRPLPKSYILTKTHCTGRCIECSPRQYITHMSDFVNGCAHGARFGDDGRGVRPVQYGQYAVKKAVHLIRNPFDNVVARFHFAYKNHQAGGGNQADWGGFTYDKEGFKQWCNHWDNKFDAEEKELFPEPVYQKMRTVPCHAEFYSYIQWHNNAFSIPSAVHITSYVIYYEEYATKLQEILKNLLTFLELSLLGRISEFHYSGGYPDYYTNEERVQIVEFIKLVGSEQTFNAMKKYF